MRDLKCKTIKILSIAGLAAYFFLSLYLYYQQTLYPVTGRFESDLPFHISMAVDDHWYYSFTAYVYLLCSLTPVSNFLIALFLALVSALTVVLTADLLERIRAGFDEKPLPKGLALGLALALNFMMAFYLPMANHAHYIGYQSGSLWHNSTYLVMRLLSVLAIRLFLDLMDHYDPKLSAKDWICFSLLLILVTGVKPSFLVVFAPVMALFLLTELLKNKRFLPVFCFGLTVVPAVLVVLWQNLVLFGSDTGNGFALRPFYVLSQRSENPKITLLLSVLFPFLVGLYHLRDFWKDRIYFGGLLLWAVGFGEAFLLAETGSRSKDGNFLWGYAIALFFLNLASLLRLLRDLEVKDLRTGRRIYLYITAVTFVWQVLAGVWYFGILLTGATYFS
ncbi:MAG: hypothetical protein K5891_03060 [Lachnospiraceae bacterium]|nr:hypothetical protein [Lachnospiraceae bacterium]